MTTVHISRASAVLLAAAGSALLFAADDILPRLLDAFPSDAAWLGQLLGAAWLAIAALNWLSRGARLGGIYGRPVVLTNVAVYFISAMVLLRIALRPDRSGIVVALAIVSSALAVTYGWLLFRDPA